LAPAVQVLGPNGGEQLSIGSEHALTWSAIDNLGVQSVDLYLSRSGPAGPWQLLAAGVASTGSYEWNATPPVSSGNAFLRVDARDFDGLVSSDISDAGFSLVIVPTDVTPGVTQKLSLSRLFPNPVSGRASATYALPAAARVRLALSDVQGRQVLVLAEGPREAGTHTVSLDASRLGAGVYFLSLEVNRSTVTRRVAIVK
jgi:hypothetical protein